MGDLSKTRMLKAFILDFDGLILDTETTEYQSWLEIYADYGVDMTIDIWADCIGRPRGHFDAYAHLEMKCGHKIDRDVIRAKRRKRNAELNATQSILPGILNYIAYAQQHGIKLAIASSSDRKWVIGHLDRLQLTNDFDVIVCEEDTGNHKPSPEPYLEVLRLLKIRSSEAAAFEDSPNGIKAAKAAGIFCIAVPNEITRKLKIQEADIIVNSLDKLPPGILKGQMHTG